MLKTNDLKHKKKDDLTVNDTENTQEIEQNVTNNKEVVKDVTEIPVYEKYSNIDFNRVSKEKMFSIIVELLYELKKNRQEMKKYEQDNEQYTTEIRNIKSNNKLVESKVDFIGIKICRELITAINNGKNFTLDEKVNIIIESILKERKDYMLQIVESKEKIKQYKIVQDELKNQLAEQINNANMQFKDQVNKEFTEEEFANFAGGSTNQKINEDRNQNLPSSIVIKAIDLSQARNSIDNLGRVFIEAIGKKSLSEYPEIVEYCLNADKNFTESKIESVFETLKSNSIIDVEMIQTLTRKRGLRVISLSNEVGKILFQEIFKTKACISEKEIMRIENDNLTHGYSIKEVCNQLKNIGYESVSMDRRNNTISISGAHMTWIPDIIVTNPLSKRKEYYEVEMGTHNTENFNNKMDKANLKAGVLKIIVPSKIICDRTVRKVENWRAQDLKKAETITIHVMTFADLKNKTDGIVIGNKKIYLPEDFQTNSSDGSE